MAVAFLFRPLFLCIPFSTFVFFLSSASASPVSDAEALLKLKQSFVNARALDSWVPKSVPCNRVAPWNGLLCSRGMVSGIRLEGMGLSGKIDVDAMLGIIGLRTVSFKNNSFSGNIPEFNRLGPLRAIYLSGNKFSGEIPTDYFDKMQSLKKIWLNDNEFTGNIPLSLGDLPNLMELSLQNNQFNGTIPSFDGLTSLLKFNLSNNKLEGHIPLSLLHFDADSFKGNPGLCGENIGVQCDSTGKPFATLNNDVVKEDSLKMVVAIITLALLFLAVVVILLLRFKRKKEDEAPESRGTANPNEAVAVDVSVSSKKEDDLSVKSSSSSKKGAQRGKSNGGVGDLVIVNEEKGVFGMPELMKAAAEVLGNGALGSAYKVAMANGVAVVVKRVKEMNAVDKEGFEEEIRRLGKLKHPNILTLLAYHYRKDEKLLISEYIPKSSLLYQLHGDRGPSHPKLNWPDRLNIVQGIAKGLGYLHHELTSLEVPHGNLKSSNVLLGPENQPLLSDFGFCSLMNTNSRQSLFAYRTPEAIENDQVSHKSDIYCLGVIIFETLTGKFPSQYNSNGNGGFDVVQWVQDSISKGKQFELLDPEIASDSKSFGSMEQLLLVGAACAESNPEQRLDVTEVIRRIEEIQEGRTEQISSNASGSFEDR